MEVAMGFNAVDCGMQVAGAAGLTKGLGPYAMLAAGGLATLVSDSCLGSKTEPGTYTQTVSNPSNGTTTEYTATIAPPGETGSMSVTTDYGNGGYTTETWGDDGSHTLYDSQTDTTYGMNGDSSWVISSGGGDDTYSEDAYM
jgi:hypothetical protein